jgi:hypothetical protein
MGGGELYTKKVAGIGREHRGSERRLSLSNSALSYATSLEGSR